MPVTEHDSCYNNNDKLLHSIVIIKKIHIHVQETSYRIKQSTDQDENWGLLMAVKIVIVPGCDTM